MNKKVNIPFEFILDELFSLDPIIKPMFGCHAIYINGKICLILRDKPEHSECNGVWIATTFEHHPSLKKEFPQLTSVALLTLPGRQTEWQMIHKDDDNFESASIALCQHLKNRDIRIGKVPKPKKKASKKK